MVGDSSCIGDDNGNDNNRIGDDNGSDSSCIGDDNGSGSSSTGDDDGSDSSRIGDDNGSDSSRIGDDDGIDGTCGLWWWYVLSVLAYNFRVIVRRTISKEMCTNRIMFEYYLFAEIHQRINQTYIFACSNNPP